MKFPVSACPQALPVEAGISPYTTDLFLLIFAAPFDTIEVCCNYFGRQFNHSG